MNKILYNKIDLREIHFFLTQKTTFQGISPPSSEFKRDHSGKNTQYISPFSPLAVLEICPLRITLGCFSITSSLLVRLSPKRKFLLIYYIIDFFFNFIKLINKKKNDVEKFNSEGVFQFFIYFFRNVIFIKETLTNI